MNRLAMNTKLLTVSFLILTLAFSENLVAENELKPHNVEILSSYQEKNISPDIQNHVMDLQSQPDMHEPYIPKFELENYQLPENFPQNTRISWLTSFSPTLSKMFYGDKAILEIGMLFYKHGNFFRAEKEFESILQAESEVREQAKLWLAWSYFKTKQWDKSLRYTSSLVESSSKELVREAGYLASLLLIKQEFSKKHYLFMQGFRHKLVQHDWDFRLQYAYLITLVNLQYWSEIEEFWKQLDGNKIKYAKNYYKAEEIVALAAFYQGKFADSLQRYLYTRSLFRFPSFLQKTNRKLAWLYYLNKDYTKSLEIIINQPDQYLSDYTDELRYLALSCLIRLDKWDDVKKIFDSIAKNSEFLVYSAFQIRSLLKAHRRHPDLYRRAAKLKFDFPKMKFHVAIVEGNQLFKTGQFKGAKRQYDLALSTDIGSLEKQIALYNLGLTYLQQRDFKKAREVFSELLQTGEVKRPKLLSYHLLYVYYQLGKSRYFLDLLAKTKVSAFEEKIQLEIRFMKGVELHVLGEYQEAIKEFLWVWEKGKKLPALYFAAKAYYNAKEFQQVLKLIAKYPEINSNTLFMYEIKALLGIRRFREAMKRIKNRSFRGEALISLRLEVLSANQRYTEIIALVSTLLKTGSDKRKRFQYYMSLGDAYFNLKKFGESKHQFYKALDLTGEPSIKSRIFYNIALTSFHNSDDRTFLKEINQILGEENLTAEIRYSLTQLLVLYYEKNDRTELADLTLEKYIRKYSYQRSKTQFKRLRLLFQTKMYNKCYNLAKNQKTDETPLQRRDRVIMAGYCGNHTRHASEIVKIIKKELQLQPYNYRNSELRFILAQGYQKTNQYQESLETALSLKKEKLNEKIRQETKLLLASNYIHLEQPRQASEELGNINQYRRTEKYPDALKIKASINIGLQKINQAIRSLLRIYYLPQTSAIEKQDILLSISEIFYGQKMFSQAKDYFEQLNTQIAFRKISTRDRYYKLQDQLKVKGEI